MSHRGMLATLTAPASACTGAEAPGAATGMRRPPSPGPARSPAPPRKEAFPRRRRRGLNGYGPLARRPR